MKKMPFSYNQVFYPQPTVNTSMKFSSKLNKYSLIFTTEESDTGCESCGN